MFLLWRTFGWGLWRRWWTAGLGRGRRDRKTKKATDKRRRREEENG